MTYKLGKRDATHDERDLLFAHYADTSTLTEAPVKYGHKGLVKNPWKMLGNDYWGDCGCAGPAHETMLWNAAAGKQVTFTDQNVLSAYSAITGFNPSAGPPGQNPTDRGCNVRDVLKYRTRHGFIDASGAVHKVAAYVALEPGNWDELLKALYVFEAVGIGIQFPSSAMSQFTKHKPWSVVAGAQIEGGHYVPVVGRPTSSHVECVTWGAVQGMTKAFYEKYCDETWGILSTEMLSGGKTLEGFDVAALKSDLSLL